MSMTFEEWVSDFYDLDVALLGESKRIELKKLYNAEQTRSSGVNAKVNAKAAKERTVAKTLGCKALKGSAKQKAWAESIRKAFLEKVESEHAFNMVQNSDMTAHAKFWIETRNLDQTVLESAMHNLVEATAKANQIGFGNAGYDAQIEIRNNALKTLTV